MMSSNQVKNLIQTLCYFDIFNYPLTQYQLWYWYPVKITYQEFKNIIKYQKKISSRKGFYTLPDRTQIIPPFLKIQHYAEQKKAIILSRIHILTWIPTIECICITGSVAANNAQKKDDIDLLIITSPGTLWTTRLMLTVITELFQIRRRPKADINQVENKWCFNLFLDSGQLNSFASQQDIYTAHEILLAEPIYNQNQTYQKFLNSNQWVKKYLPNAWRIKKLQNKYQNKTSKKLLIYAVFGIIIIPIIKIIEPISYKLQKMYMIHRIKNETVTHSLAAFHPLDHRQRVIDWYNQRLQQYHIN